MSDHLPECIALAVRMEYDDAFCICPEVRACEARCDAKRHAEVKAWAALSRDNFDSGYAAALDAARDAVAAELDVYRADCINDGKGVSLPVIDTFRHVLTVIDALKGEQA